MHQYAIQKVKVNGRPYRVPVRTDGTIAVDDLCRVAGIPSNRALLHQQPDGTNELINRGQCVRVNPQAHFIDAPTHVRGGCG